MLGAGRFGHWDSDSYDSQVDYPIHDRIAATQYRALFHVLNPFTVTRIYDAELKVRFGKVAEALAAGEAAIIDELNAAQGAPVDLGGYYRPDAELAAAAMRPSKTFNEILAAL